MDIILAYGLNKLDSWRAKAGLYLSVLHGSQALNNHFLKWILI